MKTILLIDDEPGVVQGLAEGINWESLGIKEIYESYNGEEARRLLNSRRIDIIISDIRMPRLDGLSLARIVHETLPLSRLIILSGYDLFSYAQEALRYKVFRYLSKPCPYHEIIESVEEALKDQENQIRRLEHTRNTEDRLEILLPMLQNNLLKDYIINDEFIDRDQWEILKTGIPFMNESVSVFQVFVRHYENNLPDLNWIKSNLLDVPETEYELVYLTLPMENSALMIAFFSDEGIAGETLKNIEKLSDLLFPNSGGHEGYLSIFTPVHQLKRAGDYYDQILKKVETVRRNSLEKIILSSAWNRTAMQPHQMVVTAKKYIETHLKGECSIQEVADNLQIHPGYLSSLFRESEGNSLQNYIIERRIELAARLLSNPSARIYDVAYEVGYSSPYHFSRMFKKIKGTSPKNYQIHNS